MGKKKNEKFLHQVNELAGSKGLRVGLLIVSDGIQYSGFTTYKTVEEAKRCLMLLKSIISDLEDEGSE